MTRLPNLLIAGVTKAGTTSLFSYLVQHDEVCGASLKETEYFSKLLYPDHELAPRRDYERYFRQCGDERYVLEATPNYWYGGKRLLDATEAILDHPRYIISLRDPVARFWSDFTYMKSKVLLPRDLSAAEYLDRCEELRAAGTEFTATNRYYRTLSTGFYAEHLPALIDRLGDRLYFVFFERLASDAAKVVGDLLDWLELDRSAAAGFDFAAHNSTITVRSEPVQRVAHAVARWSDTVTRRYPRAKQVLVDAYTRVNRGGDRDDAIDEPTRARLAALYAPANHALRTTLVAAGYTDVPAWLEAA
ncbi:MAG TPA: sulfotransferase domain-containing protein [Acidimicrobiales bacterium]|nr:sulfotransferase domain-containing protein [Acidimicrobiales bacterium]